MVPQRGRPRGVVACVTMVCAVVAPGCAEDATARIDVAVSELSPPGLPMHLSRIEVRVTRLEGSGARDVLVEQHDPDYTSGSLRPWIVPVSPQHEGDVGGTVFRFRATGFAAGREYVIRQARTTFVAGQHFVLPLRFEAACVDRACGAEQTCVEGACNDDRVRCAPGAGGVQCSGSADAGPAPVPDVGPAATPEAGGPLDLGPTPDSAVAPDAGPDLGALDAGPGDAGDARVACPSEASRERDRDRCSSAAAVCMIGCGSGRNLDCIRSCGDRDGPDCYACVMWNMVGCARERSCEAEWTPLACCADAHGCSVHTCARADCPAEYAAFFGCADDLGSACLSDVMACLR